MQRINTWSSPGLPLGWNKKRSIDPGLPVDGAAVKWALRGRQLGRPGPRPYHPLIRVPRARESIWSCWVWKHWRSRPWGRRGDGLQGLKVWGNADSVCIPQLCWHPPFYQCPLHPLLRLPEAPPILSLSPELLGMLQLVKAQNSVHGSQSSQRLAGLPGPLHSSSFQDTPNPSERHNHAVLGLLGFPNLARLPNPAMILTTL